MYVLHKMPNTQHMSSKSNHGARIGSNNHPNRKYDSDILLCRRAIHQNARFPEITSQNILKSLRSDHMGYLKVAGLFFSANPRGKLRINRQQEIYAPRCAVVSTYRKRSGPPKQNHIRAREHISSWKVSMLLEHMLWCQLRKMCL